MKVEFYKHNLGKEENNLFQEVLNSTFITTGPMTKKFENEFSKYIGISNSIGVTNGTTGLFLALNALGIGSGDEVITTPMSFIATSNSIIQNGAKPIFVDVEAQSGNIDAEKIEQAITPKTKAILPVHLYGQMCDMKKIKKIADANNLIIVEDSAHCIEGFRDNIRPGELSNAAVFSFYATKNISSGEGGAVCTNDTELKEKLIKLRSHGMNNIAKDRHSVGFKHWDMDLLGYKSNMNDIQASLLIPQLSKIENFLKIREEISKRYEKAFSLNDNIKTPLSLPNTRHARHLFTIRVNPKIRDNVILSLQKADIGVTVNYRSINLLKYYKKMFNYTGGEFPISEEIGESSISLPLYPKLKTEEVDYVIEKVLLSVN
ncbi:MAG: UDP-4-amino-4-deoxy-L-arabinose--oxoglutarate aminotransferase [Alphaproteobacteria bacterium MarineAlpha5_Bin11]|nr:UDP-4-amino-4,6-dideoxy-N-acetyl-beta-L-altrosamine transaminase [Pelagibacteraceae bacterium]PPR44278.1 MAG: UDP-4-amino-4-deoxy-L-arabinose--oxoglutarate aminotransferase [Alphaproteobacteria bacterium MarineAlpha5_Bin11]|tara:strand:- start:8819 stop:9943 length:1125 start_codon:yes stop_codon:yes gene_type:complete